MAEISTIARPYAQALFAAACAKAAAADWLPMIEALAQAIEQPQIAAIGADPRLSEAQVFDLISAVTRRALPAEVAAFLKLVIENGRLDALPQVAVQFRALKNATEGTADCLIESAFALDAPQLAELVARLGRKFPHRLNPELRIEPRLIGGVRVTVGDRVLDSSIKARLDAMRVQLTA